MHRDPVERRVGAHAVTANHAAARPEVVPNDCRQVDLPAGSAYGGHRADEQSWTEHELICHVPDFAVSTPIHDERPHDRVVIVRDLPRKRVNVR